MTHNNQLLIPPVAEHHRSPNTPIKHPHEPSNASKGNNANPLLQKSASTALKIITVQN